MFVQPNGQPAIPGSPNVPQGPIYVNGPTPVSPPIMTQPIIGAPGATPVFVQPNGQPAIPGSPIIPQVVNPIPILNVGTTIPQGTPQTIGIVPLTMATPSFIPL